MRRTLIVTGLAGAVLLGTILAIKPFLFAQKDQSKVNTGPVTKAQANQLPITQVVLFSSGIGYFQREGEVEGNTRVDLSFPVQDINDLLKSLVLQDLNGGFVSAVSYDSQAPIDRTLRSFAINLTSNPTFGQVLNQARGEKVEVVLQQSNVTQPATLTGVIMGVEKQRQPAGKDGVVEAEMLNLWCAEGMRSVRMADAQRVRFLNPVIDSEVKQALEVLALSHDTQKKAVSLNFAGEGKRKVRVGYVVENPIWKTSYRLVMGKNGKPFLQGWAIVENTQEEDWSNVGMALVSGRPISFRMDLYQPLYIPRPLVEPELFASLRPPTYTGALEKYNMPPGAAGAPRPGDERAERESLQRRAGNMPMEQAKGEGRKDVKGLGGEVLALQLKQDMDLQKGIANAATAMEMGDFFQYAIDHPVTLARQKSAMLPIVNDNVEGPKVSIYNARTHPKFPLHGLKFKNTTGLHLMQGPITVFEGSNYAGDARVLDLQPGEERLISYAIDLGTEVEAVNTNPTDRIISVKINKGIVHATHKVRESKTYTIKNRSEHDRLVVLEHPYRPEFKLMQPAKYNERASDVYRFEVSAPAKAKDPVKYEVIEERDVLQQVSISNSNDQQMRFFMSSTVSSPKVKDALTKAIELKGKMSASQRDLIQVNRTLNDIVTDQARLRANLKEMPPTAAAYKKYLDKFDKQEGEIEDLRDQIKKLQNTEHQQRIAFENYLGSLTVE